MKLFFNALALVFVLFAASCTKKDCVTCKKLTGGQPECSTCNLTIPFIGSQTTKFCNEDTAQYNASIAQASGFGTCTVTQQEVVGTVWLEKEVCSDKDDASIYAGISYYENLGYDCPEQ